MDASDVLDISSKGLVEREVYLHQYIDQLRRSEAIQRRRDIATSQVPLNAWAAVVAAAVESVFLEMNEPTPAWTDVESETPVFIPAVPAESSAARVLRRVSPPSFSKRNVYVPANYMARC